MKRAIILEHVPHEGPGRLAAVLSHHGYQLQERRLFAGESVPEAISEEDFLVVMGGPMGVNDIGDPRYPFLAAEADLLRRVLADGGRALGICLGAQLIAHAAGARVYPNMRAGRHIREVGWQAVDFLGVGQRPELVGMRAQETMLHWHGDTFDLPPGAIRLAATPACPNQAFRLPRQIGLQFHCEIDADTVAVWAASDAEFVLAANGPQGQEQLALDTQRFAEQHRAIGDRLLSNIVVALAEHHPP